MAAEGPEKDEDEDAAEEDEAEPAMEVEEEAPTAPLASKWMTAANVEVQGCHSSCDFTCTECEWEACEVIGDDGCKCKVKFFDGSESTGILHRHLRIANANKRKRPS